jgi:hypothetical protein
VPFTQKLMINDIVQLDENRKSLPYFVWGKKEDNKMSLGTGSYIYTLNAPKIPFGAKYLRVQYGGMQTKVTEDSNPIAYHLVENGKPIIEFSDGSSPDDDLLKVNKGYWLNRNGSLHKQTSHPSATVSDFIEIPDGCSITKFETYSVKDYALCSFYDKNKNPIYSYDINARVPLTEGEIIMNFKVYNEIFGSNR